MAGFCRKGLELFKEMAFCPPKTLPPYNVSFGALFPLCKHRHCGLAHMPRACCAYCLAAAFICIFTWHTAVATLDSEMTA